MCDGLRANPLSTKWTRGRHPPLGLPNRSSLNIRNFIWGIAGDVLRDLRAIGKQQLLRANFKACLDGCSPNVQEILEKVGFRNEVPRLVEYVEGYGESNESCLTCPRVR